MNATCTPKARELWNIHDYYGEDAENSLLEALAEENGTDIEETRRQYDDLDLQRILEEDMSNTYIEETGQLARHLDRTNDGNPLIAYGSSRRWNGVSTGFSVHKTIEDALDTGREGTFADCEMERIWDENGHLYATGSHHDGGVTVELRQLTDKGVRAFKRIERAWNQGGRFSINGRRYADSDDAPIKAMHDLWDDPQLAVLPRYAELAWGCPPEDWVEG